MVICQTGERRMCTTVRVFGTSALHAGMPVTALCEGGSLKSPLCQMGERRTLSREQGFSGSREVPGHTSHPKMSTA